MDKLKKDKANNKIPTNKYNDKFSSQIRPIKIYLPCSKSNENNYDDFVGRERLMERLFNWLSNEKNNKGSYLVTGFRGMGKTTIVERVTNRLTREVNQILEILGLLLVLIPVMCLGTFFVFSPSSLGKNNFICWCFFLLSYVVIISLINIVWQNWFIIKKWFKLKWYPYHLKLKFDDVNVDKIVRGREDDPCRKSFHNIKISINLGHEVLSERDVLSMIATSVREKYNIFVKSFGPHLFTKALTSCIVSFMFLVIFHISLNTLKDIKDITPPASFSVQGNIKAPQQLIASGSLNNSNNLQIIVNKEKKETCFPWISESVKSFYQALKRYGIIRFFLYLILVVLIWWTCKKLFSLIPYLSTPMYALRRLDILTERLVAITGEESSFAPSLDSNNLSFSLFSRKRNKVKPIADIREIETELAEIINLISSGNNCLWEYYVHFIVVFDEMDKIDPAMMEQQKNNDMPEFTDSVKGFPDGMDSRERRRNVLKLLANIKLFVSTAHAKFIFISGRELYDAYLADLSDRDFAISSIFTGVLNADSFLTPEGGQTDVRSMSEWYIANKLLPFKWLREREEGHSYKRDILKIEKPSLKWYYEYLITECHTNYKDATFVIGFLHIFAAYLTHISNGSPKKIFLYFEKYLRRVEDCVPMNDWNDICIAGAEDDDKREEQKVLYFDAIQQRTINFVYYLANPIMGTITNDLSNYGDRFLVTLSFIIDHIYKHHSRSFSWRNMEQIPDLLKTSKAPELRDSVTSIMEYLTQIHVSSIMIGLNEYKFHKSIAEEISVISKFSDEASAIFNFTLDESMSVIAHNTKLLNYYLSSSKDKDGNVMLNHRSNIALIHSNLGDLHYWDEDYYAATLEYRAAIDTLTTNNHQDHDKGEDNTVGNSKADFLTKMRCMLKLGLTYEMRKLYPNAYQIYCNLIDEIINIRWIDEKDFGLSVLDNYIDDWRGKRQILASSFTGQDSPPPQTIFQQQFIDKLYDSNNFKIKYVTNVDGVISSFAKNITPKKAQQVNILTLFEEIRYVYQSILAKLSILEKMGMSGITQTNIDVAEGEFNAIHKSVNIREKFIISADFFRKLAEILYYKNSLTILSQNQDSFYASVYYGDYDLLARLDDFCMFGEYPPKSNALEIKQDVKFFFNWLNNGTTEKRPYFSYKQLRDQHCNKTDVTLKELYVNIRENLDNYLAVLEDCRYSTPLLKALPKEKDKRNEYINELRKNIKSYLSYNIDQVPTNSYEKFLFGSLDYCDFHRRELRSINLRPACYACKYYTRSLRVLADNMFENKDILYYKKTKSLGILKQSFKQNLLYTNTNNIRTLAQTLEGFGNVMFACASGNKYEKDDYKTDYGINPEVITLLFDIIESTKDKEVLDAIGKFEDKLGDAKLSRLDKSILYYWNAFRFYIINANYHEAVGCLKKISTILSYYIQVLCYYPIKQDKAVEEDKEPLGWNKEFKTIKNLIETGLLDKLFSLVVRYTGYKYDHINLTEINELKWIYSKEQSDNIDLTKLSVYPDIRATWLRIAEIKAKAFRYLNKHDKNNYPKSLYLNHLVSTYPLIAPVRRNETTFYEEVLAYYTKVRYNDHILNNLFGGNPMVDHVNDNYAEQFHIIFYEKLAKYLSSGEDTNRLDSMLFGTSCDVEDRLELIEYLILDTLVCISNMVKVFTPHSHLTSYSKSFIAIIYNYYWEWARKYEFLYSLYQYQEVGSNPTQEADNNHDRNTLFDSNPNLNRWNKSKPKEIIGSIASGIRLSRKADVAELESRLRIAMSTCSELISNITEKKEKRLRYGLRSDRFYERLRHDIDDITINTIFSNYTAEMALRYYQLSDEANTEGEAYTEMISSLHFLNDDLNNDTCQFNTACDRFLLNTGVVKKQRSRLERLYKVSQVYDLQKAYIDGPNKINNTRTQESDFKRSIWINSELK